MRKLDTVGIRRFDVRGATLVSSDGPWRPGRETVAAVADGGKFADGISFQSKVTTLRIPSFASISSKP